MRRIAVILSLMSIVVAPGSLPAHEGHGHKVMGTVVQVHVEKVAHVEVKTPEGKTVVLTCDERTKFLKAEAAATLKDVAVGARVAATVIEEGKVMRAVEVRIGDAAPAAQASPAAKPHHQH